MFKMWNNSTSLFMKKHHYISNLLGTQHWRGLKSLAFFLLHHPTCEILAPELGIQPASHGLGAQSLNHWTAKEVPQIADSWVQLWTVSGSIYCQGSSSCDVKIAPSSWVTNLSYKGPGECPGLRWHSIKVYYHLLIILYYIFLPNRRLLGMSGFQGMYTKRTRSQAKPHTQASALVCPCLRVCVCVCVCVFSWSCPTLCDPLDCSQPGSSVHGIFQARIPEWVAISSHRRSSWPMDQTRVSCVSYTAGRFFTIKAVS